MDQAFIDLVEKHLLAVVFEEIAGQGTFRSHSEFGRAAFGDEVSNAPHKWFRIRSLEKRLAFSDSAGIGHVLRMEPTLLVAQAYANARRGKPLPPFPLGE